MINKEDKALDINCRKIFWLYNHRASISQAAKDRVDIAKMEEEKELAYETKHGVNCLTSLLKDFLKMSWRLGILPHQLKAKNEQTRRQINTKATE